MDNTDTFVRVAIFALLIVGATFLALHERHYRGRRERINEARLGGQWDGLVHGLDRRVTVLEEILMEERDS